MPGARTQRRTPNLVGHNLQVKQIMCIEPGGDIEILDNMVFPGGVSMNKYPFEYWSDNIIADGALRALDLPGSTTGLLSFRLATHGARVVGLSVVSRFALTAGQIDFEAYVAGLPTGITVTLTPPDQNEYFAKNWGDLPIVAVLPGQTVQVNYVANVAYAPVAGQEHMVYIMLA